MCCFLRKWLRKLGNGGSYGAPSGSDNDFKFVCINNNNNTVVVEEPSELLPCEENFEKFLTTTQISLLNDIIGMNLEQLYDQITVDDLTEGQLREILVSILELDIDVLNNIKECLLEAGIVCLPSPD